MASINERIKELRRYTRQGLPMDEIIQAMGVKMGYLSTIARKAGLPPLGSREYKLQRIRKIIRGGETFVPRILELMEMSPQGFYPFIESLNCLDSSRAKPKRIDIKRARHSLDKVGSPRYDRLIRRGLSLEEIGEKLGVTREYVRQYIEGSGQWSHWRESRKWFRNTEFERNLQEERQALIGVLGSIIEKRCQDMDEQTQWAEKRALEYKIKTRFFPAGYYYNSLVKLFQIYKEREKMDNPMSLKDMGKEAGIDTKGVSRILVSSGLPNLNWNIKSHNRAYTDDARRRIKIARRHIKMPKSDIERFLDVSEALLKGVLISGEPMRLFLGKEHGTRTLPYFQASRIYEAQDLGFKNSEIAELYDESLAMVDYAINNRRKIGHAIICNLQLLFPERRITRPYIKQATQV